MSALTSFRGDEAVVIPDTKLEAWKFSNLRAALRGILPQVAAAQWEMSAVFEFLETPNPERRLYGQGELWALNALYAPNVVRLVVPKFRGAVAQPMMVSLHGDGRCVVPSRLEIEVGEGADAVLIEKHSGEEAYWKNAVTTVRLSKGARLRHYRLIADDPFAVHTNAIFVQQEAESTYDMTSLTTSGFFTRQDIEVQLLGEQAKTNLSGVTLLRGKQLGDTTICINHMVPNCSSSQLFKTALDGMAHGVYQGKIHVHKDAQKTDAYQLSNNLILSPLAEMSVKPELEIYADDVKCSHGTTTGPLDDTPMFYLQSRGIEASMARRMLMEAFFGDVLDRVDDPSVQAEMKDRVRLWLK